MTTATITIDGQQYVLFYGVHEIVLHNIKSGKAYTLPKDGSGFPMSCNCYAWYNSLRDSPVGTCKHLSAAQSWRLDTMCENILEGRNCDEYAPIIEGSVQAHRMETGKAVP